MADPRIIQPSIRRDERSRAFWELCDRLTDLNVEVLTDVYNIDTVPESALPHLAEQFLVTGYYGWILADTVEKRRNLIKNAIELHKKAGTAYAIRLALASVGYPDAIVVENPNLRLDGSWLLNGSQTISGDSSGTFEVILSLEDGRITAVTIALIHGLIDAWKNARSHLIALRLGSTNLDGDLLFLDGTWPLDGLQEIDGEKNII